MILLSKKCKKVLNALINDLENEPVYGYLIDDISYLSNIPTRSLYRILEYLANNNYIHTRTVNIPHNIMTIHYYRLTELGKCYKDIIRKGRLNYIRDKWIDIIACAISFVALIVSIIALYKI